MKVILMDHITKFPKDIQKCQCKDCCKGEIEFDNNLEGAEQDEQVRQLPGLVCGRWGKNMKKKKKHYN